MFTHYSYLALRSLKRSPGLTVLIVWTIGFGVAASMTTYSVFRAVSGDPIPWKSSKLFIPQIDIWGPQAAKQNGGEPPEALSYADAMALMRAHRARLQSAIYRIAPSIVPTSLGRYPFKVGGNAVYAEFFSMLDVPFRYGGGWSTADDAQRAPMVVISSKLNQRLFEGGNSIGKTVNLEGSDYLVTGVLDDWNPQPRYYDVLDTGGFSIDQDDVFVPLGRAVDVGMRNKGETNCIKSPEEPGFLGLQHSSCVWIAFVVELDDAMAVAAYRQYLDSYARDQQRAGRFGWPPNSRLRDLRAWLDFEHVVPGDTRVSLLLAFGLLIVCLVNTTGLLLARFLRRSSEIGIRRALGAPRPAIFAQFLTEAGVVGLIGGTLGLLLTGFGVAGVSWVLPRSIAALARLDGSLVLTTLVVSIISTLLAGLYPTYRASLVQPALQLKAN